VFLGKNIENMLKMESIDRMRNGLPTGLNPDWVLIYIAKQSGQKGYVKLKEIAEATDSPSAFSAKILHQLSKARIIISRSGPFGGFRM
jgi:hypothetical protein